VIINCRNIDALLPVLLGAIALCPPAVFSQAYPNKPIRIIVPFPAGGGVDYIGRIVGKAFHAGNGTTFRILEDPTGETGRAYGAKSTPHLFVIDAQGKLAYAGAIDDDPRGRGASVDYVDSALRALAAGERPDPASTRPYGCSMKY